MNFIWEFQINVKIQKSSNDNYDLHQESELDLRSLVYPIQNLALPTSTYCMTLSET